MRRQNTIALEEVKEAIRRGLGGAVENNGGFCVFVDAVGQRQYVVDEETALPVKFREVGSFASSRHSALRVRMGA